MAFNYNEEVICDHLVTADTKKLWAVEMDLAQKLLDVCKKYDLKIWAIAGTLLGAVRHKGFIPWDDDMDFCMFREDYNKLLEIGPNEFKEPYFFQSFYTDYVAGGIIHIRNSNTAMVERGYKLYRKKNFGCAIDVFVMDAVPDNDELFKSNYQKVLFLRRVLNNYVLLNHSYLSGKAWVINSFLRFYFKFNNVNNVQSKIATILSATNSNDSKYMALIDFSATLKLKAEEVKTWKRTCFSETICLPFHDMQLPVPKGYHEVLTSWYGDYMKPVKGTQLHTNLVVDCERSYVEVLKELE